MSAIDTPLRRIFCLGAAVLLLALAPPDAHGQYCAQYNDGTQNCGIPTLQSCEQSVSGVGGICINDPNFQPTEISPSPQATPADILPPPNLDSALYGGSAQFPPPPQ